MKNKFKLCSYNLSVKIVSVCIASVIMLSTNNSIAKGLQIDNTTVSSSNTENVNNKNEFIIDAPIKFYNDINKVEKVSNFKFKVPDFLPEKNKVNGYEIRKLSDKDNAMVIFFENSDGVFSFLASQSDPVEALKIVEKERAKAIENTEVDSQLQPLKLEDVNGLSITLNTDLPARKIGDRYSKEDKKTSKYYIWKNDGVWYSLEYSSVSKGEESSNLLVNISQDDIIKIAKSLKYPDDIKNINYSINKNTSTEMLPINIYDKEDLEKAKTFLGFNPKLPIKINKDIIITSSILGICEDSDLKNNKINYELNSFYSNKDGSITFNEKKYSKVYEDLIKSGAVNEGNVKDNNIQTATVEKLNINNIIVLKYFSNGMKPQVNYLWKENNKEYYSLIFFINTKDSDEVVKMFINSKSLD